MFPAPGIGSDLVAKVSPKDDNNEGSFVLPCKYNATRV